MPPTEWTIGQLVSVQARTWAGINQPGGIARIVRMNDDTIAVKYVVDGRQEHSVEQKYLSSHTFIPTLRHRGLLLGRCNFCGSLRTDCGSCRPVDMHDDDDDSSIDDVNRLVEEHQRAFRRFKKRQAKARAIVSNARDGVLADATKVLVGIVATQDVGESDGSSSCSSSNTMSIQELPTRLHDDNNNMMMIDDDASTRYEEYSHDAFVQPEGSAERLPDDVPDQTKGMDRSKLPDFIESTLHRIETALEETYRPKLGQRDEWYVYMYTIFSLCLTIL